MKCALAASSEAFNYAYGAHSARLQGQHRSQLEVCVCLSCSLPRGLWPSSRVSSSPRCNINTEVDSRIILLLGPALRPQELNPSPAPNCLEPVLPSKTFPDPIGLAWARLNFAQLQINPQPHRSLSSFEPRADSAARHFGGLPIGLDPPLCSHRVLSLPRLPPASN